MSTNIKHKEQFKEEIRCCRELKIERHIPGFTYTHHVFVGKVDGEGCDLYHYSPAIQPLFKTKPPGKIKKVRLTFKEYDTCQETLSIFDFKKDKVQIVERDDYPTDQKAEENCIRKAESRVGEEKYSALNNNCESYVNWIFSNDNTSLQAENSDLFKRAVGNAIDGMGSSGIMRPLGHLTNGIFQQFKKSKKETSKTDFQNSDFENENSLSEKTNETKENTHAQQFEPKMEQTQSGIFVNNIKIANLQDLEKETKNKKIQKLKNKTNKTNDEHFEKKMDNTKPLNDDSTKKVPTQKMKNHTKDSNSHKPGKEAKKIQPDKFHGEKEETQCTNLEDNSNEIPAESKITPSQKLEKKRKYAKEEQLREILENAQHHDSSKCIDIEQTQRMENETDTTKVQKLEAENAQEGELEDETEAKNENLKDQSYKSHQQQSGNKPETKPSENFQNKNEFGKEQTFGSESYKANHINLWTDESVLYIGKGLVGASTMCTEKVINALENSDALKIILEQQLKKSAKKQISKCVCQKAKNEGIKKISQSISKAGVCFSVAVEVVSLTANIINIKTDDHMTSAQKNRSISREVFTSASGFAGTFIGQALIPIPVVGSIVGGVVGNAVGGMLGGEMFS